MTDQISYRLTSLRLSGMSHAWKTLIETRQINQLTLSDGLELLLQQEEDLRKNNRYARLLKQAAFRYQASVEELNTDPQRGMD